MDNRDYVWTEVLRTFVFYPIFILLTVFAAVVMGGVVDVNVLLSYALIAFVASFATFMLSIYLIHNRGVHNKFSKNNRRKKK